MAASPGKLRREKVVRGVKELLSAAKRDIKENSDDFRQDMREVLQYARSIKTRRAGKDAKGSSGLLLDVSVNADAGAALLSHYKAEWAAIHQQTEQSSRCVSAMEEDLHGIHKSIGQSHLLLSRCKDEFAALPQTLEAVETTCSKVASLGELLKQVEASITEYSRVRAELEARRKEHSMTIQFERHCAVAEQECAQLQAVLAGEERLSESLEQQAKVQALEERQHAFKELFDQQMADYRTKGEIERPISLEESCEQPGSHLEEVVIEDTDGTASLNEFLSDVVVADGSPQQEGEES